MVNKIDKEWFHNAFRDRGISQRKFAKMVDLHPSQISLLLSGKRRMKQDDIAMFADSLNAPINDVLKAVGMPIQENLKSVKVPLVGIVDFNGNITKTEVDEFVNIEANIPSRSVAVRLQSVGSFMDGWIFLYDIGNNLPPETVRTLCVVDNDKLGLLNRGYSNNDLFNLSFMDHSQEIKAKTAYPIILIKP